MCELMGSAVAATGRLLQMLLLLLLVAVQGYCMSYRMGLSVKELLAMLVLLLQEVQGHV
jgi:hypothetical protein